MAKYGLSGGFKAREGKGVELAEIMMNAANLMKNANGCVLYIVGTDQSDPDFVHVFEVWDSEDDHDASLSYPGVKELITQAMPLLAGAPKSGTRINIFGGNGISIA